MRRVTQQDIADKVGLSRTTVTKILNRDPKYITSDDTRNKVFKAAEELGYNFTQIRRPFRREYGRAVVNATATVTVVFDDGEMFDKGAALIINISTGGALLSEIELEKGVLPLKKFSIILRVKEIEGLTDLMGECEIVRFTDLDSKGSAQIGVRFLSISNHDRSRIQDFVKTFGDTRETAPLLPKH